MHYPTLIARILLGLTFFVFGLNGFFHFIPQPKDAMSQGAMDFFGGPDENKLHDPADIHDANTWRARCCF